MNEIFYPQEETQNVLEEIYNGGYDKKLGINPLSLPPSQRPRERLIKLGPEALSDQDLLAVLLNSGIKGKGVYILATEVLEKLDQSKGIPTVQELAGLAGLGESKAATVVAMLELGRRRWGMGGTRIRGPADIFMIVRHYADRKQERFISISLNGAHEVIAVRVVTVGLVNRTIVHPREVFADPISDRSCAVCVCHNHPSGELFPSPEDDEVTYTLEKAASLLGIKFLDHLIFSPDAYFSYHQTGRLSGHEIKREKGSTGSRPLPGPPGLFPV